MKKHEPTILIFVVVSVIFHLLFILAMVFGFPMLSSPEKSPDVMEVVLEDLGEKGYQIADIAPPKKEERPEKAKFLGVYDSRVDQEQVSNRPSSSAAARGAKGAKQSRKPEKEAAKSGEDDRLAMKRERPSESQGAGSTGSVESEESFEGLPEDFFPDYHIGDRTYLNVLRFPKVSYFVRLKKIFRTTWNPSSAIRASTGGIQISRGQVEVVLGVTIDRAGRLADLSVLRSSGLPLYDQEALRTIRDSAPFATPPAELLNNPSGLQMAWTFSVYL